MRHLARVALSAAALAAVAGLLAHWSRRPAVAMRRGEQLLFLREDAAGYVAVVQGAYSRRMLVDSHAVAVSGTGLRLPVVLAQLPLMLGPEAGDVLLLGWRSGVAAASALSHPIRRLDAVEPSSAVIAAAEAFGVARGARQDPRAHLTIGEPSAFLGRGDSAYDVILIESLPEPPSGPGLYRLAAARLKPTGLAAARLSLAALDDDALRARLNEFIAAFPRASAWSPGDGEVILIGGRRAEAGVGALDLRFARAGPSAWLRPLGLSYPATLLSLQTAGEQTIRDLARGQLPPKPPVSRLGALDRMSLFSAFDDRAQPDTRARLLLSRYLGFRRRALRPREYLEILLHPRAVAERGVFRGLLLEWVARYPDDPRAVGFLYLVEEREGRSESAAILRTRLAALNKRRRAADQASREIVLPTAD